MNAPPWFIILSQNQWNDRSFAGSQERPPVNQKDKGNWIKKWICGERGTRRADFDQFARCIYLLTSPPPPFPPSLLSEHFHAQVVGCCLAEPGAGRDGRQQRARERKRGGRDFALPIYCSLSVVLASRLKKTQLFQYVLLGYYLGFMCLCVRVCVCMCVGVWVHAYLLNNNWKCVFMCVHHTCIKYNAHIITFMCKVCLCTCRDLNTERMHYKLLCLWTGIQK